MVKTIRTVKVIKPVKKVIEPVVNKKVEDAKIIEEKEVQKLSQDSKNVLSVIGFLIILGLSIIVCN